jgi:CRP-like cAMP-binding protein
LLSYLLPEDFRQIVPFLREANMERDFVLIMPNTPIKSVFFLEAGMVSVVAEKLDGRSLEIGVFGREGVSATPLLLGSDQTPHHHYMQIGGSGLEIDADDFRMVLRQAPNIKLMLLRFVHVFMTQTAQSALVNGSSIIEERLARWLLMCRDRLDADEFPITHDFLSMMLGVRRSSVTHAIHLLEGSHLIRASRGSIRILDRHRLERAAGASYGLPEREYRRLIGPW